MKKILMAVFAALVTVAWVLPAMAVDTTFYGTYRVRMFSTNNDRDYNSNANRTGATYTGTRSETCNSYNSPSSCSYQGTQGGLRKGNVTDNNSWIDQRFRLSIDSKASDNLRGFVQLQIGNDGSSASSSGINRSSKWGTSDAYGSEVVARQAYISFNAGPVRVKAGRQVFGDAPDGGQSFRVSDDNQYYGLLDGGLILIARTDAFILTTQKNLDPVNLLFGYAKLTENSTAGATRPVTTNKYGDSRDTDNTLYILQATAAPLESVTGGVYFIYDKNDTGYTTGGENAAGANRPWWLGAGVSGKFAPVTAKVHAAMLRGSYKMGCQPGSCGVNTAGAATDMKYNAYAYDADITVDAGPAKIGIAGGKGSGDNNSRDTESRTFSGVAGSYGNQLGARPAIFFDGGEVSNGGAALNSTYSNGISQTTLGNVTFAELYASVKPMDDLTIGALLAGFWLTERTNETRTGETGDNSTGISSTWDKRLGKEIDLTAVYKLYKELTLVGQAAWFLPGQGLRTSKQHSNGYTDNYASGSFARHDRVSEYFAKIQYDF